MGQRKVNFVANTFLNCPNAAFFSYYCPKLLSRFFSSVYIFFILRVRHNGKIVVGKDGRPFPRDICSKKSKTCQKFTKSLLAQTKACINSEPMQDNFRPVMWFCSQPWGLDSEIGFFGVSRTFTLQYFPDYWLPSPWHMVLLLTHPSKIIHIDQVWT